MGNNRVRVWGLILVIIGLSFSHKYDNDLTSFLMGLCFGAGIVFMITGKIRSKKMT